MKQARRLPLLFLKRKTADDRRRIDLSLFQLCKQRSRRFPVKLLSKILRRNIFFYLLIQSFFLYQPRK